MQDPSCNKLKCTVITASIYSAQLSGIASSSQLYNSVQYTSGPYIVHSCAHNSRNGAQGKYVLHGTLASYVYCEDLVYIICIIEILYVIWYRVY